MKKKLMLSLLLVLGTLILSPVTVRACELADCNHKHESYITLDWGYVPFNPYEETVVFVDNFKIVITDDIQRNENPMLRQFFPNEFRRTSRIFCLCWYCMFNPLSVGTVVTSAQAMSNGSIVSVGGTRISVQAPVFWDLRPLGYPRIINNFTPFVEVVSQFTFRNCERVTVHGSSSLLFNTRGPINAD